ncbi:PRIMPOL [Mytilus coruscus]|uniref:DNA-directed primase/polymerase protein n=1 Tax=Mytilus coruscus TaxID=42192 RepID=A0A6J8DMJ8_MYTCO|nr:PRIMPOL [Mytilus coruscus]
MSVTTNNFYGAKGRRKIYHISKVLDENVKKLKSDKIPKDFRPRIDGPSVGWKTFFRQQEAFSYARRKSSDLHVFSFESESLGSETGQRMFLVASYPVFWHYYRQLDQQKKTHYELIPEGSVCKLYFDLEFPKENNRNCDGSTMTDIFIKYVTRWMEEIFKVQCSKEHVLSLDASTEKKFSRHLIFQLKKTAFQDNIHAGNFVKFILQKLKVEINKLKKNLSDVLDFDETSFISKSDNSSDEQTVPCVNRLDSQRRSQEQDKNNHKASKVMDRFTEEELLSMVVRNKNNEETLFCDQGVYTKNRNFRLYQSRKFGKSNPLVISEDNLYIPPKDEVMSYEHLIFNDSLIANIEYSPALRILQFALVCQFSNRLSSGNVEAKTCGKAEDIVEGFTKSPYPEIDNFISSTLKTDSKAGRIRHWTYFSQGELIVYDIVGYRYCHNIEREHKSNNIMLLADLKRGVYYQKCHDPECKYLSYKSPDKSIPKEALPSFYFDESFDEFDEGVDDMDILNAALEMEKTIDDRINENMDKT